MESIEIIRKEILFKGFRMNKNLEIEKSIIIAREIAYDSLKFVLDEIHKRASKLDGPFIQEVTLCYMLAASNGEHFIKMTALGLLKGLTFEDYENKAMCALKIAFRDIWNAIKDENHCNKRH